MHISSNIGTITTSLAQKIGERDQDGPRMASQLEPFLKDRCCETLTLSVSGSESFGWKNDVWKLKHGVFQCFGWKLGNLSPSRLPAFLILLTGFCNNASYTLEFATFAIYFKQVHNWNEAPCSWAATWKTHLFGFSFFQLSHWEPPRHSGPV